MDADRTMAKEEARRKVVEAMFRKERERAQAAPQPFSLRGLLEAPKTQERQMTVRG